MNRSCASVGQRRGLKWGGKGVLWESRLGELPTVSGGGLVGGGRKGVVAWLEGGGAKVADAGVKPAARTIQPRPAPEAVDQEIDPQPVGRDRHQGGSTAPVRRFAP